MPRSALLPLLTIAAALLSACGAIGQGGVPPLPPGDPGRGQALFFQPSIRDTSGCVQCHSVEREKVVVGPSLYGVATRAGQAVRSATYQGKASSAEEYLRESITRPDAAVATGYSHSVMPDWLTVLDEQQIQDLVAYLMTQTQ